MEWSVGLYSHSFPQRQTINLRRDCIWKQLCCLQCYGTIQSLILFCALAPFPLSANVYSKQKSRLSFKVYLIQWCCLMELLCKWKVGPLLSNRFGLRFTQNNLSVTILKYFLHRYSWNLCKSLRELGPQSQWFWRVDLTWVILYSPWSDVLLYLSEKSQHRSP